MAKKQMIIQLQAYSEPAGKYDPNAPLLGNEDNWFVDDDLGDNIPGRFQAGKDVELSDCGCLMVVADGMGGMNAGEVASQLAIDTVSEYFAPGKVSKEVAASHSARRELLERLIKDADLRIKNDARVNPEHAGMGSTIIIAWIVGEEMTLSWCGDSRAYRWNPKFGIEPLSTDHSYVQQLVEQGVITYADTFDHPQGNLVTRSLGDPNNAAKPESRRFDVFQKDIIMLCSDGLSGVLRDKKTPNPDGGFYPGENIEELIAANTDSLEQCSRELLRAAEQADWYDNVTVLLCQIEKGGKAVPAGFKPRDNEGSALAKIMKTGGLTRRKLYGMLGGALALIVALCVGIFLLVRNSGDNKPQISMSDSIPLETGGTVVEGGAVKDQSTVDMTKAVDKKTTTNTRNSGQTEKNSHGEEENENDNSGQIEGGITLVENKELTESKENNTNSELTPGKSQGNKGETDASKLKDPKREDNQAWKAGLLIELTRITVPAELNKCKAIVVDFVSNSTNKVECQNMIEVLKQRIAYYNRLMQYKGKIEIRGEGAYNLLHKMIIDPTSIIAPQSIEKGFARLDEQVKPEFREKLGIKGKK